MKCDHVRRVVQEEGATPREFDREGGFWRRRMVDLLVPLSPPQRRGALARQTIFTRASTASYSVQHIYTPKTRTSPRHMTMTRTHNNLREESSVDP